MLDEPLAGIDPIAGGEIRSLVSQLKNHGLGVLITDHNVRETLDIIDRAYILHGGSVLMEGTPKEIVVGKEVRKVYLAIIFLCSNTNLIGFADALISIIPLQSNMCVGSYCIEHRLFQDLNLSDSFFH